jgi:curved DNA-binding protein CbpA
MPENQDHYAALGLTRTATREQILKAFRSLAKLHHPDRGGSPDAFDAIVSAYRTLSNPVSRSEYDMLHPPPGCRVPELDQRAFR